MREHARRLGAVLTMAVTVLIFSLPAAAQEEATRYLVVFRGGGAAQAERLVQQAGGQLVSVLPQVEVAVARSSDPAFAARLSSSPLVEGVEPEPFLALESPSFELEPAAGPEPGDLLYHLRQWHVRRVRADQAWASSTAGAGTVVAIIDTGVATDHPDLAGSIRWAGCHPSKEACQAYDVFGHGTFVAGIVAARFGGGLAVGVAPEAGIASYNVAEVVNGRLGAFPSSILEAMLHASGQGHAVINLSLGGLVDMSKAPLTPLFWMVWKRVINEVTARGTLVVAAAGNQGMDLNGTAAIIPADIPDVLAVGATSLRPLPVYPHPDAHDIRAAYSNYGAAVDLVAPGGDAVAPVFSTFVGVPPFCGGPMQPPCGLGYAAGAGTSFSAPHVAAVAALVKSQSPHLSPQQLSALLIRSAENLGDRQQFGHGMVDAAAALGVR